MSNFSPESKIKIVGPKTETQTQGRIILGEIPLCKHLIRQNIIRRQSQIYTRLGRSFFTSAAND